MRVQQPQLQHHLNPILRLDDAGAAATAATSPEPILRLDDAGAAEATGRVSHQGVSHIFPPQEKLWVHLHLHQHLKPLIGAQQMNQILPLPPVREVLTRFDELNAIRQHCLR